MLKLVDRGGWCLRFLTSLFRSRLGTQRSTGDWADASSARISAIGTLVVNATACLAIGFLSGNFAGPQLIREEYRIGLTVGILGGFTTFSAFGMETFNLANAGEFSAGGAQMSLSCGSVSSQSGRLPGRRTCSESNS